MFALLDEFAEKAKSPRIWTNLQRERRSFLGLFVSIGAGVLIGCSSWYQVRRAKQDLHLLFELELLLAQLDGLVNVAIAQGNVTKALQSMKLLVGKVGEYGFKASRFFEQLEGRLSAQDYAELKQGAMAITVGLDTLEQFENTKTGDTPIDAITEALITMQSGIRLARSKTRELIEHSTFFFITAFRAYTRTQLDLFEWGEEFPACIQEIAD